MKNKILMQKFLAIIIIFGVLFSPTAGLTKKSIAAAAQPQDITSPGQAVGKAVAAAAVCYSAIELQKYAKQGASMAAGAVVGAVKGKVAAIVTQSVPVNDTGTQSNVLGSSNSQQINSSLSDSQKCLRDTVVKILGDYIVDQTITWIQGGGTPQFVTNWGNFLQDAVNTGVGEAVRESNAAFLCAPFKAQVRLSLFPVQRFKQKVDCTLDGIVGNIDNFMNDFSQGGWIGYGGLWQPNNNYFGQVLLTYDEAAQRSAAQQQAAQSEAVAGQGFLSTKRCIQKNQDEIATCVSECNVSGDPCGVAAVKNVFNASNVQSFCSDNASCDQYENTTPGNTVASMATKSLDWDLTYLTMSQSWIASLTNAVVNRVITSGLSYMGASNVPNATVADVSGNASAALPASVAAASISQLFQNTQNIKTDVTANEQAIADIKNNSLSYLNDISSVYSGSSCSATMTSLGTLTNINGNYTSSGISDAIASLTADIANMQSSYLVSTSTFQTDASQLLQNYLAGGDISTCAQYCQYSMGSDPCGVIQWTKTSGKAADVNLFCADVSGASSIAPTDLMQRYDDFTSKYSVAINDANSGAGIASAQDQLNTLKTNKALCTAKSDLICSSSLSSTAKSDLSALNCPAPSTGPATPSITP